MAKTSGTMIFINGLLAGATLPMVSFIGIFRGNPEYRLFLGVLIFICGLTFGYVFQFCYQELRATNALRRSFEQSGEEVPSWITSLYGKYTENSMHYLNKVLIKCRQQASVLLLLNILFFFVTVLVSLTALRWEEGQLIFTLLWVGIAHVWIYALSVRCLKNGQYTRKKIFGFLEIHRLRLKGRG